ncbi:MAG: outer membrane protein assembly factor [Armatimonadota bacterium]
MRFPRILMGASISCVAVAVAQAQPPRATVSGTRALDSAAVSRIASDALSGRDDAAARRAAAEAIEAHYRKLGYTLAHVVGIVETTNGLEFQIAEGRIRSVQITGNTKTRAAIIRKALDLVPGMVWREAIAADDRARLGRLGIFDDVFLSARAADDPAEGAPSGEVDVVVRVKEGQTGNVAATVGYGQGTGFIGFASITENNLMGTAERFDLQWQRWARIVVLPDGGFAQENARQAFRIGLRHPALGRDGYSYELSAYDQNTIFLPTFSNTVETLRNYERRAGWSGGVGRRIPSGWNAGVRVRSEKVGYDSVPDRLNPPLDELANANTRIGTFAVRLEQDRRGRTDFPRTGGYAALSHEVGSSLFGGRRDFTLDTVDVRRYLPWDGLAGKDASLAGRVLLGTSGGALPLSEQYFVGGFDLLRGYDIYSIRGTRMALASAELRVPMGSGLVGVVFVDHGGAWTPGQTTSGGRMKTGYGAGLRFASPLGPIRLDFAYGNRLQTYVSLGQAF